MVYWRNAGTRFQGFKSWLCHLLAYSLRSYSTSLYLSFLRCKARKTTVSTSWSSCEGCMSSHILNTWILHNMYYFVQHKVIWSKLWIIGKGTSVLRIKTGLTQKLEWMVVFFWSLWAKIKPKRKENRKDVAGRPQSKPSLSGQLVHANGLLSPCLHHAPSNQSILSQKARSTTESNRVNFQYKISQTLNSLLPFTSPLSTFSSLSCTGTQLPPHRTMSVPRTSPAITDLLLCTCGSVHLEGPSPIFSTTADEKSPSPHYISILQSVFFAVTAFLSFLHLTVRWIVSSVPNPEHPAECSSFTK